MNKKSLAAKIFAEKSSDICNYFRSFVQGFLTWVDWARPRSGFGDGAVGPWYQGIAIIFSHQRFRSGSARLLFFNAVSPLVLVPQRLHGSLLLWGRVFDALLDLPEQRGALGC